MAAIKQCTCAQCGVRFETERKRKYCCLHCTQTAMSRRKGKKPLAEYKAKMRAKSHRTCPQCGVEFKKTRHDNHVSGPQIHCSRKCRGESEREASAAAAVDVDLEHPNITRDRLVYRRWSLGYGRGVESQKYRRWGERARKPCADCDGIVGAGRTKIYPALRCQECAKAEKRRISKRCPSRRAAKARRRALERGSNAERFDPFEIFERDKWRCHLCGIKTPKRLRGSFEPNAPELNHIISLAEGGEHSRRNTACACRKCNLDKGARSQGQLRLIA